MEPKEFEGQQSTIKRLLRPLVYRTLSPRMFQFLRFRWWRLSSYFSGLITSRFVKRTPQVRGFGAALILVTSCEATPKCKRVGSDGDVSRHDQVRERQRSAQQLHPSVFGALQAAL